MQRPAAGVHVAMHPQDIQANGQICFILGVGSLGHNVQFHGGHYGLGHPSLNDA